jgi:SP family general alpha glucoside:H+ symporter-like MFS transporter
LPETKGRTFEELDILFAQRVPAKEFAKYEIDAFDDGVRNRVLSQGGVV